jgi:hypothetical protein
MPEQHRTVVAQQVERRPDEPGLPDPGLTLHLDDGGRPGDGADE